MWYTSTLIWTYFSQWGYQYPNQENFFVYQPNYPNWDILLPWLEPASPNEDINFSIWKPFFFSIFVWEMGGIKCVTTKLPKLGYKLQPWLEPSPNEDINIPNRETFVCCKQTTLIVIYFHPDLNLLLPMRISMSPIRKPLCLQTSRPIHSGAKTSAYSFCLFRNLLYARTSPCCGRN